MEGRTQPALTAMGEPALGPASAQVGVGCSNNMQLQPPRPHNLHALSYASCNDCSIMHSTTTSADPELVGGGWSCMLLLHPAPTCTDAGSDLCTFSLQWLVVFLLQLLAQILHLHPRRFHPLQLAPVAFFLLPTGADYLHSSNLHCVVVVLIILHKYSSRHFVRHS